MMRAQLALIVLLVAGPALADDSDAAALSLADSAPAAVERAGAWHVFVEGAAGGSRLRDGRTTTHEQRLSLDVQYDQSFAPGWRAVFADRLDVNWQGRLSDKDTVNTLKDAYLSWQPQADRIVDLGRINARYGVAAGYNPTDYFRDGAIRSVVSIDPVSLKKNRQGSVMLRGQTLWDGGSLTALYSPRLADRPNDTAFNPNLGATNNRQRWLVAASHPLADGIAPQWLLYGEEHRSPQLGFNLSTLPNDATVAYLEWSGGRSPSLLSQALNRADDSAFRSRLAAGLTYTTVNRMSFTLEYEYNGAGLDQTDWNALSRGSAAAYGQYRKWVQSAQELPTRQTLFFYSTWQDAMINHLDLSAMVRFNIADRSRLSWLEARYRWARADLALQWQINSGRAGSEYGALSQERMAQVLVRYFF
jgi:opacity protein-like surface antigen